MTSDEFDTLNEKIDIVGDYTVKGFERVDGELKLIRHDISGLKRDVGSLKTDVSNLKTDVGSLKFGVASLKDDMKELKQDVKLILKNMGLFVVRPQFEAMERRVGKLERQG